MKPFSNLFLVVIVACLIISCESNDIEHRSEFKESQKEWSAFKKSSNNSYTYVVTNSSWSGVAWETTIKVTNGVVKQRSFKYASFGQLDEDFIKENGEWVENESQFNTHSNSPAAPLLTLDEIYNLAKNEWLIDRDNATVYLETKNSGLISLCGYTEKNCADDCFVGISISNITAAK